MSLALVTGLLVACAVIGLVVLGFLFYVDLLDLIRAFKRRA